MCIIYIDVGNMKGEGLLQGGVLIITPPAPTDSQSESTGSESGGGGELRYVYQEQTGSELPMDEISTIIANIQNNSGIGVGGEDSSK